MAYQECPDCDLILGRGVNTWHNCNKSKVIKRLEAENERLKKLLVENGISARGAARLR